MQAEVPIFQVAGLGVELRHVRIIEIVGEVAHLRVAMMARKEWPRPKRLAGLAEDEVQLHIMQASKAHLPVSGNEAVHREQCLQHLEAEAVSGHSGRRAQRRGDSWHDICHGPSLHRLVQVCPAPLFGRLVDSMAKVMGVQHAAMQAFKTMPMVEVANVLISEVEQPKSTGICAPEAAKKWQKSRGALELEMAEMDLDDDVQRMLMELPDHEVRSAIQRARSTAQFPSRWLKGYVKRYWEQESRGEMRGPEVQVDPDLEELLRELPAHEARRALDKARNIADNPKAWLVGYCRRYWKEQQFHRNWT
eukprot:symbB.v1.2.021095.t1/scaffold1804.1/size100719/8